MNIFVYTHVTYCINTSHDNLIYSLIIPLYCISNVIYLNSFCEDKYHNGIHKYINAALVQTNAANFNYSSRAII